MGAEFKKKLAGKNLKKNLVEKNLEKKNLVALKSRPEKRPEKKTKRSSKTLIFNKKQPKNTYFFVFVDQKHLLKLNSVDFSETWLFSKQTWSKKETRLKKNLVEKKTWLKKTWLKKELG